MDVDADAPICPPAPKRRCRSASEAAEADAYDAVVRQLVGELTVRLDALPSVEGLMSASGLQRQQAVDSSLPPICSPRQMSASPAGVYCVGSGVAVSAELTLSADVGSPIKRRETDSGAVSYTGASSSMMRRDTDIEGDLASAAAAETNTSELGPTAEEDETASEGEGSVSDDDGETEPSREVPVEELVDDGAEADTEDGDADTGHVEHVSEADENNTSGCLHTAEDAGGVVCQMRRQKHTGELALGVEAPVWMWGAGVAVVTSYLWIVALLIKSGGR